MPEHPNSNSNSNSNRLIHETSPYLRQHAHNPVDWYPWGEEALDRARREGKPILLSIGYSACHWCHVMAHESFEDEATAQVMNELFVNIKVDREERPDLDKIYQTAFQMLHRRAGGWPLTMFLTHDDHAPFVGGTYFPKTPRYGMPAFTDILRRVSAHYHQQQPELRQQNQALLDALRAEIATPAAGEPAALTDAPLRAARDALVHSFDPAHGGFGGAPKFPHPTSLERLLRRWAASVQGGEPDRPAETAVLSTLQQMALGGIYDHLGGGFYRYSVDAEWQIPHFEKMLYDNGPLLALYAQAWQATQDPLFRTAAEETGAWLIREMQDPAGGYYATLDADSEGEEGKFYLWTPDQVRELLSTEEYVAFAVCYGLEQPPNFEDHAWHLRSIAEASELASRLEVAPEQVGEWLAAARRKLFGARSQRIWPGRDEKILTAWNGLAIRGMAIAGRHLGQAEFVASAERALDFIHARLWRDGRLLAVHKDGQARLNAYLDDYAFLIDGILELLQCRWRDGDLDFALALADVLLDQFEDRESGRVLLHRHRPRSADPAAQAGPRRRLAGRQRYRRAGPVEAGSSHRPDGLSGRRADLALGLAGARTDSQRLQRPAGRAGGFSRTGANDRATRPTGGADGVVGAVRPALCPEPANAGHPRHGRRPHRFAGRTASGRGAGDRLRLHRDGMPVAVHDARYPGAGVGSITGLFHWTLSLMLERKDTRATVGRAYN